MYSVHVTANLSMTKPSTHNSVSGPAFEEDSSPPKRNDPAGT